MEDINRRWREASCRPSHQSPTITDTGLMLGYETRLVRRSKGGFDLARDAERALGLLAITGRRVPRAATIGVIKRAIEFWERGDPCLAHLHLAFAAPARLEGQDDAWRLFLADVLIDAGMTPRALAKEMGFGSSLFALAKYDPDQPRNPAGSGAAAGQWTKEPADAQASPVPSAEARGPAALFGAAFIPAPNGGIFSEGEVPGRAGLRYRLDRDTGTLRLLKEGDTDPAHALVARLSAGGVYRDIATGVPIARAAGEDAVLIDLDRTPGAARDAGTDREHPKLCPDPERDRGVGRMLFDEMYQQYVRDTVNSQHKPQLPPDLSFALPGGGPSGWTFYDNCRESNGAMIEAKGNYKGMLLKPYGPGSLTKEWLNQAKNQIDASQGRRVEWYFHDPSAADFARELFASKDYEKSITIHVLPYPGGVPKPNPRIR